VDPLHLEEPVAALVALDWLGRLDEEDERYVLLQDPAHLPLEPLAQRLLLPATGSTEAFWAGSGLRSMSVAQALAAPSVP
jgi:membrane protein